MGDTQPIAANEFVLAIVDERTSRLEQRMSYFDQTLTELRTDINRRPLHTEVEFLVAALKEATLKYETQMRDKFESVNQFREQLRDQQATLARKAEVDIRLDAIDKRLEDAVASLQLSKGREGGMHSMWAAAAVVATLALSGLSIALAAWMKR